MSIITSGYGENSKIITQGYGYIEVIVSVAQAPPKPPIYKVIRIPIKFKIPLSQLGLIDKFSFSKQIKPLNLAKLKKISVLMSELNIAVPKEIKILLDSTLSVIDRVETIRTIKEIEEIRDKLYQLSPSILKKQLKEYSIEGLLKLLEALEEED